jgi:hypothetical protein
MHLHCFWLSTYVSVAIEVKRKNTLSKKVASSSDHPIRQEYNRVRNKVKGAVNKMKKKFEIVTIRSNI